MALAVRVVAGQIIEYKDGSQSRSYGSNIQSASTDGHLVAAVTNDGMIKEYVNGSYQRSYGHFGQVDVRFVDGTQQRVHFFASRLKYSRWVDVTLVPNQRVESLVRALVDHFAAFGGMPLLAVFDRPKTVALTWRRDGVVTEWNPTFAEVALDLGLGVELCWPYQPTAEGQRSRTWSAGSRAPSSSSGASSTTRISLCSSPSGTARSTRERPSRATGVAPLVRIGEERAAPAPAQGRAGRSWRCAMPIMVGPTAVVMHEGHSYSMPPEAIGIAGTLYLYRRSGADRRRPLRSRAPAPVQPPAHARTCPSTGRSRSPRSRASGPSAT